jgi:hypothetical protein
MALAIIAATSAEPNLGARTASADALSKLDPRLRPHVSGTAALELGSPTPTSRARTRTTYFPVGDDGCATSLGNNIKVNQNCLNLSDGDLQGAPRRRMRLRSQSTLPTLNMS